MTLHILDPSDRGQRADRAGADDDDRARFHRARAGSRLIGMITPPISPTSRAPNSACRAADVRERAVADLVEVSRRLPELCTAWQATERDRATHRRDGGHCLTDAITGLAATRWQRPNSVTAGRLCDGWRDRRHHEQSSRSDQDNALLLCRRLRRGARTYFAALARSS